jgi:hypothetical protein
MLTQHVSESRVLEIYVTPYRCITLQLCVISLYKTKNIIYIIQMQF